MGKTRARSSSSGVTLDAGALIALDRGDRRMIALLDQALADGVGFRVPAGVVGQAWRDGRRQVTLARFLRADEVQLVPLDGQLSRSCGEICGCTGTTDVIDASVAIVAREHGDVIVTSDPEGLLRLDPGASVVRI
ncbi:MAG: hypothetical protein JW940_25980 [Polyangiaceae bacterium]|nr:hypothetical protein [Polyangiaceae bacterium]